VLFRPGSYDGRIQPPAIAVPPRLVKRDIAMTGYGLHGKSVVAAIGELIGRKIAGRVLWRIGSAGSAGRRGGADSGLCQ